VAYAQIGVEVGHLELCGARGKLLAGAAGSFEWVIFIALCLCICHNVVFMRKSPFLGLTVIVVGISVFVFEINYSCCTVSIGWPCRRDSMMCYKLSLA
jgi:hypothetical protein